MGIEQQSWRIRVALMISVVINCLFIAMGLSIDLQRPPSRAARILADLTEASNAFAAWIAPRGHDTAHFVGGAVIAIVSSFFFYSIFVWFLLSLPVWWRQRR